MTVDDPPPPNFGGNFLFAKLENTKKICGFNRTLTGIRINKTDIYIYIYNFVICLAFISKFAFFISSILLFIFVKYSFIWPMIMLKMFSSFDLCLMLFSFNLFLIHSILFTSLCSTSGCVYKNTLNIPLH